MIGQSRKIWLLVMLGLAAASGIIFAVVVRPIHSRANNLRSQYLKKVAVRKNFAIRAQGLPTDSLLRAVEAEDKLLNDTLAQAVRELSLQKAELLPKATARPSIYWLDVLRKTRLSLTSVARKAGMEIPRGLTFKDSIPSDEKVPGLLWRLEFIEELIRLGAKSGVSSFSNLSMGNEEVVQSSGKDFLRKLNISLSMTGSLDSLISLIHSLRKADSFFVIEDMEIKSEGGVLKAKAALSMLYFLSDESEPERTETPVGLEKNTET
jgi:hypothetical protein